MSYKLLTHPSISTYIWTISLVLTGPCGSSTIHAITIQSSHGFLQYFFAHIAYFQHHFSALILFSEVIGVLKLLGYLVQAFKPQTRDDQAIEQSL